ncbi:MAG: UvrD-helicase domain-containing protein [Clostridia bacterium]|nr:UvrD-helicase domain-containing protein [Clostridia bacterium]
MTDLIKRYNNAKRTLFNRMYRDLNPEQREAVFTVNNPLLILAGAGSGKTTVLVRRIAFIIKYGNAYMSDDIPELLELDEEYVRMLESYARSDDTPDPLLMASFAENPCAPWNILAITFTNKAANEIKLRLASTLDDPEIAKDVWAGTFHSVCMRILRVHGAKLGYEAGFSVYDTEDTKKAISSAIKECNIDEKSLPLKSVINAISRAKENLLSPDAYLATAQGSLAEYKIKLIAKVYAAYQKRLAESNAMDFDDIIMNTVLLLRDFPDVRAYYQKKFRYVCIDEFQDTNKAQLELSCLFANGYRNLMVVGDDDQSIYSFRGAVIENILNFDKSYPDARIVKLEQNYRSTDTILGAANAVIANNVGRHKKTLRTSKKGGAKITVRSLNDQNDEARYILDIITRSVRTGAHSFKDYAILYRTNAQSSAIERAFARSGIPYRMLGGTRFNDREEIRDITAYLQIINNRNDRERLKRIINKPARKIGAKTLAAIEELADYHGKTMFWIMEHADEYVALKKSAKPLIEFAGLINELSALSESIELDALVRATLDRSGYRQSIVEKGEEEKDRLDNLDEFVSGVIDYIHSTDTPSLVGFLEENALVADVDKYDENADAVVMMTIHSAKGLEFPVVFLPGMEDGIFPGMQTITDGPSAIEEERRLAYVAITRAKSELYLLSAEQRLLWGRTSYNPTSRFLKEIPPEFTDAPKPQPRASQSYGYRDGFGSAYRGGYERTDYNRPKKTVYYDAPDTAPTRPTPRTSPTSSAKPSPAAPRRSYAAEKLSAGDRVKHITFGEGTVISVTPAGVDVIYEIMFDNAGIKKLMASYAKLQKL